MRIRGMIAALVASGLFLLAGGVAQAATVLFIGGSATPTAGADASVMTYLQTRYGAGNVTYQQASATSAGDELAFDVLVASSTPSSGDIRNKFQNSTTGIVNWEEAVVDDDSGEFQLSIVNKPGGKTQINIIDNNHPITSGFSKGLTTIFTGGTQTIAQSGNISIGVHELATENNSADATLFVADTGAVLFGDGSAGKPNVAAGRRVTFPITDNGFNNLNADGLKLFGAAVDWAAAAGPDPVPQDWNFRRDLFDNSGGRTTAVGDWQNGARWVYMRAAIDANGDVIGSDASDFLVMDSFSGTDWRYGSGHPTVRLTRGTVHPDDGEAPVVAWESDFTGSVDYSYILTENNNNAAASPGYQLFFWDDSASLLTLLAKDDLLGTVPGDMFASESVFGSQDVAPGDMLLMAIDDGGNGNSHDRTIVQAYVTRSAAVIPEPSTFLIWSLGLLGLAAYARRRRTK